jgi:hypothetical protein
MTMTGLTAMLKDPNTPIITNAFALSIESAKQRNYIIVLIDDNFVTV